MKIGIIGAGNIGGALARRFRAAGHEVAIANSRGPQSLADLARETGATAVSVRDAARGRDVVVVTIPMNHVGELPRDLFADAPRDLVVIDTNNYYPRHRDGRIAGIEDGNTESRWVGDQFRYPVVKAFNNIAAPHLQESGKPAGAAGRIALPVAGDDAAAKAVVMGLVDEIGFDAVDAGTIDESWRQQPGTPAYGMDFDRAKLVAALGEAKHERTDEWRATQNSPGTYDSPR
jgi:predicted dinucleotide-binding enzyme